MDKRVPVSLLNSNISMQSFIKLKKIEKLFERMQKDFLKKVTNNELSNNIKIDRNYLKTLKKLCDLSEICMTETFHEMEKYKMELFTGLIRKYFGIFRNTIAHFICAQVKLFEQFELRREEVLEEIRQKELEKEKEKENKYKKEVNKILESNEYEYKEKALFYVKKNMATSQTMLEEAIKAQEEVKMFLESSDLARRKDIKASGVVDNLRDMAYSWKNNENTFNHLFVRTENHAEKQETINVDKSLYPILHKNLLKKISSSYKGVFSDFLKKLKEKKKFEKKPAICDQYTQTVAFLSLERPKSSAKKPAKQMVSKDNFKEKEIQIELKELKETVKELEKAKKEFKDKAEAAEFKLFQKKKIKKEIKQKLNSTREALEKTEQNLIELQNKFKGKLSLISELENKEKKALDKIGKLEEKIEEFSEELAKKKQIIAGLFAQINEQKEIKEEKKEEKKESTINDSESIIIQTDRESKGEKKINYIESLGDFSYKDKKDFEEILDILEEKSNRKVKLEKVLEVLKGGGQKKSGKFDKKFVRSDTKKSTEKDISFKDVRQSLDKGTMTDFVVLEKASNGDIKIELDEKNFKEKDEKNVNENANKFRRISQDSEEAITMFTPKASMVSYQVNSDRIKNIKSSSGKKSFITKTERKSVAKNKYLDEKRHVASFENKRKTQSVDMKNKQKKIEKEIIKDNNTNNTKRSSVSTIKPLTSTAESFVNKKKELQIQTSENFTNFIENNSSTSCLTTPNEPLKNKVKTSNNKGVKLLTENNFFGKRIVEEKENEEEEIIEELFNHVDTVRENDKGNYSKIKHLFRYQFRSIDDKFDKIDKIDKIDNNINEKNDEEEPLSFDELKAFYKKMRKLHEKCGINCAHLQRFYSRIGFNVKQKKECLLQKIVLDRLPKIYF